MRVHNGEANIVVATCQVNTQVDDPVGNRRQLRLAIGRAADAGARVVVLPELANTGYMFTGIDELRRVAESVDGPTVQEWASLARERNLIIVGGFAEAAGADDEAGAVYNSAVLVDESGIRACYRKVHLWDKESDHLFTAGTDAPPVIDTAVGRLGVMICYDLEFPEWVRIVALNRADLLCAPVTWPRFPRPAGERPDEVIRVQAGASSNRMFIAVADRAGVERGQDWTGGSVIVDADGHLLTELVPGEEALLLARVDLSEARDKMISARNDVFTDRRPKLYSRLIEVPNAAV